MDPSKPPNSKPIIRVGEIATRVLYVVMLVIEVGNALLGKSK